MKNIRHTLYAALAVVFTTGSLMGYSQTTRLDSLHKLLPQTKMDTARANILYELAWEYLYANPDTGILLANQGMDIVKKLPRKKQAHKRVARITSELYNITGALYQVKSDYANAVKAYKHALKIDSALHDTATISSHTGNLGIVYYLQGNYARALDMYFNALKMAEKTRHQQTIAAMLSNIGIVYVELHDPKKALRYYMKALKLNRALKNNLEVGSLLGNIGVAYFDLGNNTKALKYYLAAVKLSEQTGDMNALGNHLHNIGVVYRNTKNYEKALEYQFRSLKINEELGIQNIAVSCHADIGTVYMNMVENVQLQKDLVAKAEKHLLLAAELSRQIGIKKQEMDAEDLLGSLYEKKGSYALALVHYKNARHLKDSIFNADKNDEITRNEMLYSFEKKQDKAKARQEKKEALAREDLKRKEQQLVFFITGIALVALLTLFILKGYRQKQKDNRLIARQKTEVEEKNTLIEAKQKEILDSIYYARRIQRALLPSDRFLYNALNTQNLKKTIEQ
ncbi:MAG TPA: tetratricopeptide repeat protein [Flavobacteriales bacterium]|nr:tetratricopeptide repeat protein [Flavobacteriales bacterium]